MLIPNAAIPREIAHRLRRAADDRSDPMRLAVVATVTADGRPTARTLVIRGADDGIDRIWLHTDRRTAKVGEIVERGAVCAVVYDRRDGVQLRLNGTASVLLDGAVVDAHWAQLGLATRHLYETSDAPGTPIESTVESSGVETDPRTRAALERLDTGDRAGEAAARRNFAVIELAIDTIDWLQTLECGMRRALLRRDSGWVPVEIGA